MAIPELLVADVFKTGTPPQVAELVGGTTINAIGGACSANAGDGALTVAERSACNYVAEYRGEIFVAYQTGALAINIDGYNRGTGLWTSRHTAAVAGGTGLFVANTGTVQRLFMFGRSSVGGTLCVYTDDGVTWTTTASLGGNFPASIGENPSIMFNNKLYTPYGNSGGQVYEFDPIALSFSNIAVAFGGSLISLRADLCVHDDRLFLLAMDDSSAPATADYALFEFTGSGFTLNTTITADSRGGTSNMEEGQLTLFKDPSTNNLIAICNGAGAGGAVGTTNNGSTAFQLVPSGSVFTPTEITNTVIPVALRPGARTASLSDVEDRWFSITVNDTAPGTAEVYLFFAQGPAPGTGYSVYQWVNASTLLASPVAGPSTIYTIPQEKFGGGSRINKGVGNQCVIEKGEPVLGGYQISYRVYGTQSSQSVTLWYSLDQETPDTQASISAQTGGSGISGGNQVDGITGDDGSTLFTLRWDLTADGVPNGDAAHLLLDIN